MTQREAPEVGMNPWVCTFKNSPRSRKVRRWKRFYHQGSSVDAVRADFNRCFEHEFLDRAVILELYPAEGGLGR